MTSTIPGVGARSQTSTCTCGQTACTLAPVQLTNVESGGKALLAIDDAFTESERSWTTVFESLRKRGLKDVALLVADGAAGIWSAFGKAYPRAKQQRLHKIRNVLDKVPERMEETVQEDLRAIMHAENRAIAETLIETLAVSLERCYSKAATCLRADIDPHAGVLRLS